MENRTVTQVARDLDVSASLVHSWVRQAKVDNGDGPEAAPGNTDFPRQMSLREYFKSDDAGPAHQVDGGTGGSLSDLILREPGSASAICGVDDMLLGGRRASDECQFVMVAPQDDNAGALQDRLRRFVDERKVLEVAGVIGVESVVCSFSVTGADGLVLRGVLRAEMVATPASPDLF
jgi:hypothetical protein